MLQSHECEFALSLPFAVALSCYQTRCCLTGELQMIQQLRHILVWSVILGDSAFAMDVHVQRMLKGVLARLQQGACLE